MTFTHKWVNDLTVLQTVTICSYNISFTPISCVLSLDLYTHKSCVFIRGSSQRLANTWQWNLFSSCKSDKPSVSHLEGPPQSGMETVFIPVGLSNRNWNSVLGFMPGQAIGRFTRQWVVIIDHSKYNGLAFEASPIGFISCYDSTMELGIDWPNFVSGMGPNSSWFLVWRQVVLG